MSNSELPTVTLATLCPVIGCDQRDVENWLIRQQFRTKYEEVPRGRARRFSLSNALELAYVAALVRVGIPPAKAIPRADTHRRHAESGLGGRDWLILPAGAEAGETIGSSSPDVAAMQKKFGSNVPLIFIPVKAIGDAVKDLFR